MVEGADEVLLPWFGACGADAAADGRGPKADDISPMLSRGCAGDAMFDGIAEDGAGGERAGIPPGSGTELG